MLRMLFMNIYKELVSAEEFASRFSGPITLRVSVPVDPSNPSWTGQVLALPLLVTSTVREVKEALAELLGGFPVSKQQLKGAAGFLKDADSLATMNVGDGDLLELSAKTRGGKR